MVDQIVKSRVSGDASPGEKGLLRVLCCFQCRAASVCPQLQVGHQITDSAACSRSQAKEKQARSSKGVLSGCVNPQCDRISLFILVAACTIFWNY